MDYNFGAKEQLDYSQLVFRQIDRIAFVETFESGTEIKDRYIMKGLNSENVMSALYFLESLIVWKLSEKTREEYLAEKKELKFTEKDLHIYNRQVFHLLMKYLSKTGLITGQRKFYTTKNEEVEENESNV